jgi:hypothetical protein
MNFGADGHLRREGVILASVEDGKPGTAACVLVGDARYDIIRGTGSGWHFVVARRSSSDAVCEFLPFRIRSGGRLRWGNVDIQLRRRPLGSWQWYFRLADDRRVLADARATPEDRRLGRGGIEVRQRTEQPFDLASSALVVLVFGCWLVMQLEATPIRASGGPPLLWTSP